MLGQEERQMQGSPRRAAARKASVVEKLNIQEIESNWPFLSPRRGSSQEVHHHVSTQHTCTSPASIETILAHITPT